MGHLSRTHKCNRIYLFQSVKSLGSTFERKRGKNHFHCNLYDFTLQILRFLTPTLYPSAAATAATSFIYLNTVFNLNYAKF